MTTDQASRNKTVCPVHKAALPEPPFIQQGQLRFQAHQVGWIICGFFTAIAVGVSAWLINKHLRNYTNKGQQRYIVRCLLLVPIYAIISTLSYILYDSYASPLILIRDSYESVALHAFFCLLLEYISHNVDQQKEAFREIKLEKWLFPLGFIRKKPSGLFFLQIMRWGVLQYAVLRPIFTVIALVLNWFGLYCETSWSPIWGYVYVTVILSISVSVAMYCLIQLYIPISHLLKPHHPLLKFLSIKSVVFLTFWQATLLSLLATFKVVKDTPYMTAEEINIGFAALLETFEMMAFAFLHLKAFTYIPYRPQAQALAEFAPTPRLRSLGHVLDFRDILRQFWAGCVYIWARARGFEPDRNERHDHLQRALGQRRVLAVGDKNADRYTDFKEGKTTTEREHPWLKLDLPESDVGLLRYNDEALEQEINSELRRLRMVSEYNRRNAASAERTKKRPERKKGSSHRRGAASSEQPGFPTTAIPTGLLEEGLLPSSFGHRGPRGSNRGEAGRSFWMSIYDRVSMGGHDGRRQAVPQTDEDAGSDDDGDAPVRVPSWNQRASFSPLSPQALEDDPPRSMVVLSRPPLETRPPLPPPKPADMLPPTGVTHPLPHPSASSAAEAGLASTNANPARADSFMKRVFTTDIASSEDSHAQSREQSQEMLAISGMPWPQNGTLNEHSGTSLGMALKQVPQGGNGLAGRDWSSQSPRNESLILPISSSARIVGPIVSPVRSSYGSLHSSNGGPASPTSHPQSRGGPSRPMSQLVMPNPLSPARYPGLPSQDDLSRHPRQRRASRDRGMAMLPESSSSDATVRPARTSHRDDSRGPSNRSEHRPITKGASVFSPVHTSTSDRRRFRGSRLSSLPGTSSPLSPPPTFTSLRTSNDVVDHPDTSPPRSIAP